MSPLTRLARLLLIAHACINIAQGIYTFLDPKHWSEITGFEADDRVLQMIGLTTLATGWYQLIFVAQGNRRLMLATVPLRLGFAGVMYGWGRMGMVLCEGCVVWFCLVGVFG
ncbi:hypothetical protein BDW02DRAFT_550494 [Decorospora gaudefroyi]|uniref:Uncharacterized protein n=1 Tax=Decorospora gaudefroyi TaxID=184978 RepID=A0A6A5KDR2_9PLEO|nr:hypothetical protein BDW02DRAFT_550494 [Decorospora gaudefroyi]